MDATATLTRGFELPLEPRLPRIGAVDAVALEARAADLAKRSIKRESKLQALDLIVRMIDLTTLEGADTPGKVAAMCAKAVRPDPDPSVPSVAAVCVYPNLVSVARERLGEERTVRIASVATAFPSGQSPIDVKLADVRAAVELGADEVDMVIDRGAFLSGRYAKVYDEIVRVKEAAGRAHLKVILETGELGTYDNVRRASLLAMAAGADFIKTSTGKVSPAATLPVTLCMLEAIRDVEAETGRQVGMKPAGGIRHAKLAIQYLCVLSETLGRDWLTPGEVPVRRLVAPERRAHADPQAAHRRLPVPRPLQHRLMSDVEHRPAATPAPLEWDYAPAPEARDIVRFRERYGLFVGGEWVAAAHGRVVHDELARRRGRARRGGAGGWRGRRRGGGRRARRVRRRLVVAAPGRAGQVPVPDRPHPAGARA